MPLTGHLCLSTQTLTGVGQAKRVLRVFTHLAIFGGSVDKKRHPSHALCALI